MRSNLGVVKYNGRLYESKQLLRNAQFMRNKSFRYLVRGTGEFAGVVVDIKHVLEESSGKRKIIATVLRPNGEIDEENLTVFNNKMNDFIPVYYELGDILILTGRPSKNDDQNIMQWLPPEEAKPISALKEELRTLEIAYNEIAQHAEEAEHARMLLEMEVRHARSLQISLERQLKAMSGRLISIEGEVELLRAKMQSRHNAVMAMKEQVNEMAQALMKLSKYEGMEVFELTKQVLGNVEELITLISSQEPEEIKRYSDKLGVIIAEIQTLKQTIKERGRDLQIDKKGRTPPKKETIAEVE